MDYVAGANKAFYFENMTYLTYMKFKCVKVLKQCLQYTHPHPVFSHPCINSTKIWLYIP